MPRKKKSEETLSQLKMDRLKNHLREVEDIITKWIAELSVPSPFSWSESREASKFETEKAAMPVRLSIDSGANLQKEGQTSHWIFQPQYVPPTEQDAVANHMLRKHLRKRSIWTVHTQWEQRLKRVAELAPAARNKLSQLAETNKGDWQTTQDYEGTALEMALDLSIGQERPESYWQKPGFSRGVWRGDILIEKSARSEEVEQVGNQHRTLIKAAAQSQEMRSLAIEWGEALKLQARMQELASKTLKSSDILYPCQFCRRLW